MSAQEHDYELGTLDEATLERDESLSRRNHQRGDERRWMILGGAGTLALMTALGAALALSGSGAPHRLAAGLGSPFRALAPVAAHASVEHAEPERAEPARVAKRTVAKPAAEMVPAAVVPGLPAKPALQAQPATEADKPAAKQPAEASADDPRPFAGLPTLVDEPDDAPPTEEAEPAVDFAHDDNPFAQDEDEDEGAGETGDQPEAEDAAAPAEDSPAEAPTPAPA